MRKPSHHTPPQKANPKGICKVIHSSMYLISTPWLSLGRPNQSLSSQHPPKTPSKILPKPIQNPPKTLPTPTFKSRRVQDASQNQFLERLGRFLMNFGRGLGPQSLPKWSQNQKKRPKFHHENKHVFWYDFLSNFHGLGIQKWLQNRSFFDNVLKTSILWKSCSRRGGSSIFRVRSLQKTSKIDAEIACEKKLPKNISKIDFDLHFGLPKPPKITPRAKQIASNIASKKRLQPLSARWAPSTDSTPQVKPKRAPKRHPFT